MSVHRSKYAAVVVGAGPAGICALGNMLERGVSPVLWVDDEFNGGRVNRAYREVPSNTKTKLFIDFAEALTPFRKALEKTPSPNAIDRLREFDQDKATQLGNAADMLLMLTRGLMQLPGVAVRKGRVTSASVDSHKGWTIQVSLAGSDSPMQTQPSTVISDRLILCTGSSPNDSPLPVDVPGLANIHLDTALSPSLIANFLPKDKKTTVAVVGASHSAVLVLMNLSQLALSTHPNLHIKWFTRHSLRYAEFMDGWILRDNTGLKGEAATWAKQNLEPEKLPSSPVAKCITPISYEKENEIKEYEEHLPGCDYYVQAIGYSRDPIPQIKRGVGTVDDIKYDHLTGSFSDGKGEKVPGMYGAGIAWPERVTDPYGNVEYAVGFFKFMKYLKRVSCDWN
ncbi:pyridine nucleotide-disulfide oxidoreductase-like protein 3 [Elsinoe australis]|uniref:Pyridine nucleotide-disulfide oxidoreductase-like protein 3 n=1 Tax=Elsinoe australis TaxID=40998 RepID=A0A4U7B836_9PEZI|nr:pyridine nucleotide-disulfide oxidoreductase-like protein 3 [Elsinoe australis]